MTKPNSRIAPVAKFANDLIPRMEDFAYADRVEVLGIVPWYTLFFDKFGRVHHRIRNC